MDNHYYYFADTLIAAADRRLNNKTIVDLWNGFCFRSGRIVFAEGEVCCFYVGEAEASVPAGAEYVVLVTDKGIAVSATDYASLARGLMALMMRIEAVNLQKGEECFRIECCYLEGRYSVGTRMIHFCVFPETSYLFLKKCIRLAGTMQYTHVVLEFWGMLRFDCLKELSWPNAYSKEQASGFVREIEDMGMQAIPMFNHLGHAAACRVSGGKHVVLDQNPKLAPLFSPDGWSWSLDNPEAAALLVKIRGELYEIFPHSDFFHLGCDEVYSYEDGDEEQIRMRRYLKETIQQVYAEGKRPIIWGDMLLNREMLGLEAGYFCSCDTPENAQKLLEAIPPYTVIADWQYDVDAAPIRTSLYFQKHGFQVLGVPWYEVANCQAHVDTVRDNDLMGVMVSTWHTLAQKMPHVVADAVQLGAQHSPWSGESCHKIETETAALLRKVCSVEGSYEEAGWTDYQIFKQARPMV